MTPKPKNPGSGGGTGGTGPKGRPSQVHGSINAGKGVSSAQQAITQAAHAGRPGAGSGGTTTPAHIPTKATKPPATTKPTAPPSANDIHLPDIANTHILRGDGGRQGGHLAGTGLSKKTEFPKDWDGAKILSAAYQVTQGPPVKGPFPTKDADGNVRWAYNYEGVVDGVTVRTTVFADNGEIRTAFPTNPADPGVIENPAAPNPPPKGIPQSEPPRYSHPDLGGDGSWTWEGPKGDRVVRVVQDAQGNVTTTDLGPYKKK
ncbi:EndoU domain-containing protein [Actinophytocola xanthii]|uniref:Bacterial EndoU nuclease domain-containing protein n=1 Tax=Actinophytocola xanthii TaxID=1912961 RepID=A0A1Q8CPC6_9PSEU|nr:EndoU domain-containing protein [Actinophytocola xanthii]OLF16200.1 hypothetical protein BU204_17655 [Actinophytocola xanthii]